MRITISTLLLTGICFAGDTGTITGTIKARGVRNAKDVVVYLEKVKDNQFAPPKDHALMDQLNLVFVPHVLPVVKGTTVDFLNSDDLLHNVFSPDAVADKMNLGTWGKGEKRSYTFKKLGNAAMLCNVHPEMLAYVVVLENPYFDVSKVKKGTREGTFTIKNVPAGHYTIKTWHEKLKPGTAEVDVKAGQTAKVHLSLRR